jgi:hypothetical protein
MTHRPIGTFCSGPACWVARIPTERGAPSYRAHAGARCRNDARALSRRVVWGYDFRPDLACSKRFAVLPLALESSGEREPNILTRVLCKAR